MVRPHRAVVDPEILRSCRERVSGVQQHPCLHDVLPNVKKDAPLQMADVQAFFKIIDPNVRGAPVPVGLLFPAAVLSLAKPNSDLIVIAIKGDAGHDEVSPARVAASLVRITE